MREVSTRWLPIPLRVLVVALVAGPAVAKFGSYGQTVEGFAGMGVPAPELMVPVVGVVELVAVVAAIFGFGRLPFFALTVSMAVAVIAGGPAPDAIAVLAAAAGLAVLGTGALSAWQPEASLLPRRAEATE